MGFLRSGDVFSKIVGKIGAIYFRAGLNGKVIAAHMPGSYTTSQSSAAVLVRKKFRYVISLYNALKILPNFMSTWRVSLQKGKSVMSRFLSVNIPRATGSFNPTGLSLSPTMKGFDISGSEITIAAESVSLAVDPLGVNTGIIPATETKLISSGVLVLSNPIEDADDDLLVVPLISASVPTSIADPLNFSMTLAAEDSVMVARYQDKKVMLIITSLTAADIPVRTSETFYN